MTCQTLWTLGNTGLSRSGVSALTSTLEPLRSFRPTDSLNDLGSGDASTVRTAASCGRSIIVFVIIVQCVEHILTERLKSWHGGKTQVPVTIITTLQSKEVLVAAKSG